MRRLFFLILFFTAISCIGNVSADIVLVLQNNLTISDKTAIFSNDGSIPYYGGSNYKNEIMNNLIIKNNGDLCSFSNFTSTNSSDPTQGIQFEINCNKTIQNLTVDDNIFLNDGTYTINKVYNVTIGGDHKQFVGYDTFIFSVTQDTPNAPNLFSLFFTYFKLGILHIFTGIDHMFFIIGFIAIAVGFRPLVKSVTGFTLSHSFTLTLAATGILVLSSKIVEPIIALSIVVVGLLGVFSIGDKRISRFWLIFGFGLFHGLGFAGAIAEIGFPKTGFVLSLLGFNLGIEAAQLSIVLLVYPLIKKLSEIKGIGVYAKRIISGIVALGGTVWLVQRILLNFFQIKIL